LWDGYNQAVTESHEVERGFQLWSIALGPTCGFFEDALATGFLKSISLKVE
jgi:hypothetical protein